MWRRVEFEEGVTISANVVAEDLDNDWDGAAPRVDAGVLVERPAVEDIYLWSKDETNNGGWVVEVKGSKNWAVEEGILNLLLRVRKINVTELVGGSSFDTLTELKGTGVE